MKSYKSLFEVKRSRLAHGNTKKKNYNKTKDPSLSDIPKMRVGSKVVYTGEETPDSNFEGLEGVIVSKDKNPRMVVVQLDNSKKYLMNKKDLKVI